MEHFEFIKNEYLAATRKARNKMLAHFEFIKTSPKLWEHVPNQKFEEYTAMVQKEYDLDSTKEFEDIFDANFNANFKYQVLPFDETVMDSALQIIEPMAAYYAEQEFLEYWISAYNNVEKPASEATNNSKNFIYYLKPENKIIYPLLVSEFSHRKAVEYGYLLVALEKLNYLSIILDKTTNWTRLQESLEISFGKEVGSRQQLNFNITRFRDTSVLEEQGLIKKYKEKIAALHIPVG